MIKLGIIPAAGAGLRSRYIGKVLPKCLFPVYDRPVIHYVVQNMVDAGVTNIIVVTNTREAMVQEYLAKLQDGLLWTGDDREFTITTVHQKVLNGDGAAVLCALDSMAGIKKQPFFVSLGDDISFPNPLIAMCNILRQRKAMAVEGIIAEPSWDKLKNACSVDILNDRIMSITEKPKSEEDLSWIRGCGVYAFHPDAFNDPPFDKFGQLWMSDVIKKHIQSGRVYHCILESNININTPNDLLEASQLVKQIKGDNWL